MTTLKVFSHDSEHGGNDCHPRIWEYNVERFLTQERPRLHSKFQASLSCIVRTCQQICLFVCYKQHAFEYHHKQCSSGAVEFRKNRIPVGKLKREFIAEAKSKITFT